jgi:hypothetical protein
MSQSPFARALITSACVAGAVFTASALPLALNKAKVVDVELQNQPIFASEMRDLAAPYLSISGVFSVALGFGVFGILGWRTSVQKLSEIESQSSTLTKDLVTYQAELERIKFSESRLRAQNLTPYLDPSSNLAFAATTPEAVRPSYEVVTDKAAIPSQDSAQSKDLHRTVDPWQVRYSPRPLSLRQKSLSTTVEPVSPVVDPQGEVLTNLLQQLDQLSRQVEDLRQGNSSGIAA